MARGSLEWLIEESDVADFIQEVDYDSVGFETRLVTSSESSFLEAEVIVSSNAFVKLSKEKIEESVFGCLEGEQPDNSYITLKRFSIKPEGDTSPTISVTGDLRIDDGYDRIEWGGEESDSKNTKGGDKMSVETVKIFDIYIIDKEEQETIKKIEGVHGKNKREAEFEANVDHTIKTHKKDFDDVVVFVKEIGCYEVERE